MDLLTTVGQCDNGYACVYQNNLSWSSPTTPLPAEAHPRVAFERLFGDGGSAADRLRGTAQERQPARLGERRYRPPAEEARPGRPQQGQPVSGYRARSGAPHPESRSRDGRFAPARSRPSGRRARRVCRSREADVRSAGAGAAGRRHARHHVPAGARNQHAHLSRDRRARTAPPADAQRRRSGEAREGGEDQRVPRFAVRLFPGETEGDAGWRRHAARSFALPLWQRHGQRRHARSRQSADPGGGRRRRQVQGRPPHPLRRADAAGEPAPDAARTRRRPTGLLRRQQGQGQELLEPLAL